VCADYTLRVTSLAGIVSVFLIFNQTQFGEVGKDWIGVKNRINTNGRIGERGEGIRGGEIECGSMRRFNKNKGTNKAGARRKWIERKQL
jgi:hypothetical protein